MLVWRPADFAAREALKVRRKVRINMVALIAREPYSETGNPVRYQYIEAWSGGQKVTSEINISAIQTETISAHLKNGSWNTRLQPPAEGLEAGTCTGETAHSQLCIRISCSCDVIVLMSLTEYEIIGTIPTRDVTTRIRILRWYTAQVRRTEVTWFPMRAKTIHNWQLLTDQGDKAQYSDRSGDIIENSTSSMLFSVFNSLKIDLELHLRLRMRKWRMKWDEVSQYSYVITYKATTRYRDKGS